jgi:Tfp pilus assembly protein PilX
MKRPTTRRIARGSALALAMIVLGVLTVIGVAAVSLSTQERTNASAYGKLDAMQACANAATAKIWKELGIHGTMLAASDATITSLTLADGTILTAPAHYDTPLTATIKSVSSTDSRGGAKKKERNLTNKGRDTYTRDAVNFFVVHCKDASGRELEIEIGIKFAL